MKQAELDKRGTQGKNELCQEIEQVQAEVNRLALQISTCQGSEFHYIWTNLANARAYLATALEASRQLKSGPLPLSYEI